MSGSSVEHHSGDRNYKPPPFGRQSFAPGYSQSPRDNSSPFEVSPIPHFSPLTSLVDTTYSCLPSGVDHTLSVSTTHLPSSGQPEADGHDSPDPDDFYRQPDECELYATDDFCDVTTGASGSMAPSYHNPNDGVSSLPANVLDPSRTRRPTYRSISDSPSLRGPSASESSNVPPVRPRNASFRDLVSKFEQKSDQALPLPSASRPTSRAPSPAGSADGGDRSRLTPRRKLRDSLPPISVTSNPRPQAESTPASPVVERLGESNAVVPPPLAERIPISHPRRPLFGEVLSVDTQLNNLGYGIPARLRRRGSDGSITSPVAEYSSSPSARSPLTPTAWYLGQANSLESVSIAANTAHQRLNGHRRVQSDSSGNPQKKPLADPWDPNMAVAASLQPAKPGDVSPGSPNSKSRIPVSSHRLVSASGPERISPIANNPTFSSRSNAIPLPPKGSSRLPKPSLKDSPPRRTEDGPASFAMTTRGRRDMTIGQTRAQVPERNQHLQAYISVPPPKVSPPLRSSRPRQPVSQGVPISPTSRVGERVSSLQKSANRDTEARNPRPRQRRIPELGNVDFETRRQRIQQAFNRTVQENERKEEHAAEIRRRRSQRIGVGINNIESPSDEKTLTPATAENLIPPPEKMATLVKESTGIPGDDKEPRSVPQLNLITSIDLPNNDAQHTTMDSPTLGVPDGLPREWRGAAPDSSITTGSNETQFDPEPQSGLIERRPSSDHRTLLNHIMQIRESSDSDSCDEPDCSISENDDKRSIQIMLRDTTYFHSTSTTDTEEPRQLARYSQAAQDQTRWSLSSWSSSVNNQNDTCDEECDETGDDPVLQMPPPAQEEPPTQSCSAASTSPPSDNNSPIQDLGVVGPDTLHTPQLQSSSVFSTPPSLARQGKWDSRRVTQLYLEELTRGRSSNSLTLPPNRTSQDYSSLEVDTRAQGQADSLTDDPVFVPRFEEKPIHEHLSHSASLVGHEDWEHASPYIMDWMHVAAEDEDVTPAHDKPHFTMTMAELESSNNDSNTGLGLSVSDQAAYELQHAPVNISTETESTSEESQTVQATPSVSGRVPTLRDPTLSTGSSADSSFQRVESTQSAQAADSSATSLVPSVEHLAYGEPKKSPSPEQRRLKKRRHIIKELVDTEYTFGRDMKVVDDIYKGTSSSCLDLSADDVKVLFGNSDLIVQFSMSLQDALKKAARSVYIMPRSQRWGSRRNTGHTQSASGADDEQLNAHAGVSDFEKDRATTIGQAFVTHMIQLEKVYTEYLRNHDAANKKLQLLQRNPKVAIWLKECRDWASDLTSAWDLDSLLVKPVQRILKYPLLLAELLEVTPDGHPDRASLSSAFQEVTNISVRINEMKKRAELVTQVVGRKRNQSDVRAGLSKAFGRRTEKLRQQVGLSDMYEDRDYDALAEKFAEQYIQLQLVSRDVQDYVESTKTWMIQFNELASTIEGIFDLHQSQSHHLELDSKWRSFKMSVQDIITDALPEHIDVVMKSCIDPTSKVIALYTGPERVMKKRQKRLLDYGRYKSIMERGEKPDKKTTEQGEQFVALNETLKEELPRLFALSAKFGQACLKNLADIQLTWWAILQKKVVPFVGGFPDDMQKMISDWNSAFVEPEAQVLSLGICNGSVLADTVNLVNFNTPSMRDIDSSRRPSTTNSSNPRPHSFGEDSPKVSHDYGTSQLFQSPHMGSQAGARHRADSYFSARTPPDPSIPPDMGRSHSQLLQQVTNPTGTSSQPPQMEAEPFPSLLRLSLDTPFLTDVINAPSSVGHVGEHNPPTTPAGRYSSFFSSAMPMSDTPSDGGVAQEAAPIEPTVLFHVASLYEFNIDRSRREAGYPYLTYDTGDIFDVVGEKGELWLARNQDDPTRQIGWIWTRHFAKLST